MRIRRRGAEARESTLKLNERMVQLGRSLAEREAAREESLATAHTQATELHRYVAEALEHYHGAVLQTAPQLEITLGAPRVDDKHLHSVEFELMRGRYRGIVVVKSRGEVTLVGPFHAGKNEGPCRSYPAEARTEIDAALGDFLVEFIGEAVTP